MPVGGAGAVQERRCLIHDSVAVSPRRRQWRKRGRSLRSWSPTLSATAGSPARTRRERWRGCASLRSDLIDPAIAAHHGRVVKRTGDGILIDFRSVVDAVRCAIQVQNGMVERNADLPPERRIEFRIGVHLGDVVEESDGDLMGDGVNIAARLEGISEPGGICLSEQAYWQVKGRLDLAVIDLGPIQLKNIADPIRIYSLQVGASAHAKPASAPLPEKAARRVSPSSSCRSPISAATRSRIISSTGSRRA